MHPARVRWQLTETNGARVEAKERVGRWRLYVEPGEESYTNAQIDDYRCDERAVFEWGPGVALTLRARFSAEASGLVGTAGFGFWNAPFGPGAGRGIRLPQAAWFFYASKASNLPLAPGDCAGNGWFAATIDAGSRGALLSAPFVVPVLLLNQVSSLRRLIWPAVRQRLSISFERLSLQMASWREYKLIWRHGGTLFMVDGTPLLSSPTSPRGPLGFVAWMDNQRMVLTPKGQVGWGLEAADAPQWLEIEDIRLDRL